MSRAALIPAFGSAGALPILRLWGDEAPDVRERTALWSGYYNRFFGTDPAVRREIPAAIRPVSPEESLRILKDTPTCNRPTVRRCLMNLIAVGYRPPRHRREHFDELANQAVSAKPDGDPHLAIEKLRALAHRRGIMPGQEMRRMVEIDGDAFRLDGRHMISVPTQSTLVGDYLEVTAKSFVPRPFPRVATIVLPQRWHRLGPFFVRTQRKPPNMLHEEFVVDWNTARFDRFDVHLRVDYTRTSDTARTDYSLIYERHDRILVDDGYVEAARVKHRPNWTLYTGVKRVKFASAYANLLAPAVIAMFLESHADWIFKAIDPKRRAPQHGKSGTGRA